MENRDYEELKKKLCKELEELKASKSLGMGEIEAIDKITHAIKNIDKIIEGGEYSHDGDYSQGRYRRYSNDGRGGNWSANGSYGRSYEHSYGDSYDGGDSYARRGMHYVRGHYSHAEDEDAMLMDRIEEMLSDNRLTVSDKSTLRRAMELMRK